MCHIEIPLEITRFSSKINVYLSGKIMHRRRFRFYSIAINSDAVSPYKIHVCMQVCVCVCLKDFQATNPFNKPQIRCWSFYIGKHRPKTMNNYTNLVFVEFIIQYYVNNPIFQKWARENSTKTKRTQEVYNKKKRKLSKYKRRFLYICIIEILHSKTDMAHSRVKSAHTWTANISTYHSQNGHTE